MQIPETNLTEEIFRCTAPYNNPYQSNKTRVLFVCSAGLLRSPTGAYVGSLRGYNTRSCGSHLDYALIPLSVNLINWSDHIVFVNKENYNKAIKTFEKFDYLFTNKSHILNIPDIYEAFHPKLINLFNEWFDELEKKQ